MKLLRPLLIAAVAAPFAAAAEFTPNHLFVASVGGDQVLEVDGAGNGLQSIGVGEFTDPRGIAFGPDGKLYVTAGSLVHRILPNGIVDASLGASAGLTQPRGIAFGPDGALYVTSGDRVVVLDEHGDEVRAIGVGDGISVPVAIDFGPNGHLFIAAAGPGTIFEYDASGALVRVIADPAIDIPMGLAFGPGGRLHVSSFFGNEIIVLEADGSVADVFTDPALVFPAGLSFGPTGNLFVSAFFGQRIVEFSPQGTLVRTIELPAGATFPEGLAFAPRRFSAKVEGRLAIAGAAAKNVSEKVVLAYAPGSRRFSLVLTNGDSKKDLASVFGSSAIVFHGFESADGPLATWRLAQGAQFGAKDGSAGSASLHLSIAGKLQAAGSGQAFLPTDAEGPLQRATPSGAFRGTLTTTKPLE